jgi:hypothetical protein
METHKAKCGGYGMVTGIYWVTGLGILFGALLGLRYHGDGEWPPSLIAALLATGIACAYILLAALDWLMQRLALSRNPLPNDLEIADRAVAREQATGLKGGGLLARQLRRLLNAWGAGASGPQIAAMANSQTLRTLLVLAAEIAVVLVLLSAAAGFSVPQELLTLGTGLMLLAVIIAVARFQLATQLAGYVDSHLLARIGNDTPAAAGAEFAQQAAKSVGDSISSLTAAQAKFTEQLAKAQDTATAQYAKAQQEAAAQLAKAQQESASQITKAQTDAAAQVAKAQADMAARLSAAQEQAAAQLGKAQTEVATQLGRVSELASSIDHVLKLQQAVDGTLKGVTVTEEFKNTLLELKRHLAESDTLLKNVSKPRAIRLVEAANE